MVSYAAPSFARIRACMCGSGLLKTKTEKIGAKELVHKAECQPPKHTSLCHERIGLTYTSTTGREGERESHEGRGHKRMLSCNDDLASPCVLALYVEHPAAVHHTEDKEHFADKGRRQGCCQASICFSLGSSQAMKRAGGG